MDNLFLAAENAHASASAAIRVSPSMPVLYFGDLEKYRQSPLRVVTTALNPSRVEFPSASPFQRFPSAAKWAQIEVPNARRKAVQTALNWYFYVSPYRRWFDTLEPVLAGFGASFYGHGTNCALHTDLLSPVATDPTWRKLSEEDRDALALSGVKIWHGLIAEIRPHIVLLSVAAEHLARLEFRNLTRWSVRMTMAEKPRLPIMAASAETTSGTFTDFVFARAAQTPFGHFSNAEKRLIGPELRGLLRNW